MNFLIITNTSHIIQGNQIYGYAPYVREMNIWTKFVQKVIIIAPISKAEKNEIHLAYNHQNIHFKKVKEFDVLNIKTKIITFFKVPKICFQLFCAMKAADHIHLRCPGNMGLLGCLVQILFPTKIKTAKYAGNWDPKSQQPWSYRLQKMILNNTYLTKNIQVLVYGDWPNSSQNIKPFFTATYSENENKPLEIKNLNRQINFTFVGMLVSGKNPIYAVKLIQELKKNNHQVHLNLYGDGILRKEIFDFIVDNNLQNTVTIHGNQNHESIKLAYQNSHFSILPSQSEGWPKAVVEAMFWGCVPIATSVSCVPQLLDFEKRGLLLTMNFETDLTKIISLIQNQNQFQTMQKQAANWSKKITTNVFENQIKLLLHP